MEVFLARQSIYNKNRDIVAYEILYRNSLQNKFDENEKQEDATYKVIQNIASFGLDTLTNKKRAFINFPEDAININMATLLPNEKVVIEVLETVKPTKEVIENLKLLRNMGYSIALDDVITYNQAEDFLDVLDIVKVDYKLSDKYERFNIAQKLRNTEIKLLAEKIEVEDELIEAEILGFEYFQGYYFSKPTVLQIEDIATKNRTIFNIITELLKEDFDINRMEELIKSDIGLTYKFLRFINSAYFNFMQEVSSIKQSIMLVGRHELRKWLSVIWVTEMSSLIGEEYSNNRIIRARMCELVYQIKNPKDKSLAFMVGLFSDIHMLMKKSLDEFVDELPVTKDVKDALLGKENIYRDILDLVLAYENMEGEKIENIAKKLGVDTDKVGGAYLESIEWSSNLFNMNR